jgi:hypothetical protein
VNNAWKVLKYYILDENIIGFSSVDNNIAIEYYLSLKDKDLMVLDK